MSVENSPRDPASARNSPRDPSAAPHGPALAAAAAPARPAAAAAAVGAAVVAQPAAAGENILRTYTLKGTYKVIVVVKERDKQLGEDDGSSDPIDPIARMLHASVTSIYAFFLETFKLAGIDGEGNIAPIVVCFKKNHAVSYSLQLSAEEKCSWTFEGKHPVIVAHEYTHAIVAHEYTHAFVRHFKPIINLKLHEGLANIFGVTFNLWQNREKKEAAENWKLNNYSDLSAPVGTQKDVAVILGHAFYLAVRAHGSKSYEKMIHVWYKTFHLVTPQETLKSFISKTITAAQEVAGDALLVIAVRDAWVHVYDEDLQHSPLCAEVKMKAELGEPS